jgi:hypothetical protein
MARLISTEAEFAAWDPEIEPDVDIKREVLEALEVKKHLDKVDTIVMLLRYGV